MPNIEDYTAKLARHLPAKVTDKGMNYARNKAIAKMFMDINDDILEAKDNLTISHAHGSYPFMVGVNSHPQKITGVYFFHIDKRILINDDLSVRNKNREHILNLYVEDDGTINLGIDGVNKTTVEKNDIAIIYDQDAYPIYVIVDMDKLPDYSLDEKIEFIPVYTTDWIEMIGWQRKLPRWHNETDIHYKNRIKQFSSRGMVTTKAITDTINEYVNYYGFEVLIREYREFHKAFFVIDSSYITDIDNYRKYKKEYSDNYDKILIKIFKVPYDDLQTVVSEVEYLLNMIIPQGSRYELEIEIAEGVVA